MDLKQKYDQHKTTFDEQAWEGFSDLRKASSNGKSNIKKLKKYNMKNITLLLLLFGFASMAIFFSLNNNKWSKIDTNKISNYTQSVEKKAINKTASNETKTLNKELQQKGISNNIQQNKLSTKTNEINTAKNKAAIEIEESLVLNSNGNDVSLLDTKTGKTLEETSLKNFSPFEQRNQEQIEKAVNTKNDANSDMIEIKNHAKKKFDKTKIDYKTPQISPTPKTFEKTTLSTTNNSKSELQDLNKTNLKKRHTVLTKMPIKETLIKHTKTVDNISIPLSKEIIPEIADKGSPKLSMGIDYMMTVSYNITDGGIPIRPAQKRFIHLKYIKGQYNAEAVAGFNFYETLNANNRVTRKYYTDFGLSPGINMFNNEKHVLQMNVGVYHRIFADEDFLTSKKPTRWGLMGFLGYQIKLGKIGSTGLQYRFSKDFIRNIDRDDQYKIQHLGLSFFMDFNFAAIPEAFRNMRKNKK